MDGIESLWSEIQDKDDVAQKRYLMFKIFDKLLTERFSLKKIKTRYKR